MRIRVAFDHQPDAGDDQNRAEDVHHPVETLEERRAEHDEDRAKNDRADHAPEQHPVLIDLRYRKAAEEHDEDEDVVDGQRLLDEDRKSTRLNSSHGYISYAVFCLKKKKKRK